VRKYLPSVLILAAVGFVSPAASAQPLRTVAVIDAVKFPPKAKQAHDLLRSTLEEVLAPKNWFLAEPRRIADCGGTIECMTKVAGDTKTDYVVRLSGARTQDDGYDITVELFTTQTARIQNSGAYCDYCDLQRINEVTGKSVLGLLTSALKEEAALKEAKKAAIPAVPTPTPPTTVVPPAIVTPPPIVEQAPMRWLPWTMIGAGALAAGYGAWALHKNGDSTGSCSDTPTRTTCEHYSSGGIGVGALIGGGALAVAGTIWLLATPSHTTAVAISPNHVALNVRF
jgi:hypothetical protein